MLKYTLADETRSLFAQDEPAVKAAIATIANQEFNAAAKPQGIGKYEGGVKVNGREIAIKEFCVRDDFASTPPTGSPEEKAVIKAIQETARIVTDEGIGALSKRYGRCTSGDPLRSIMGY